MATKVPTLRNIGERLDHEVRQGSTLGPYRHQLWRVKPSTGVTGVPFDLTGCQVRGQVRRTAAAEEVTAELDIEIAIDPTDGYYDYTISDEITADMEVGPAIGSPLSTYVFDTELELPDGRVVPLLYGALRLQPEVTKP